MNKIYCMGIRCSIKYQCLRYNKGLGATMYDGTTDRFIRGCTNQKLYVKDENNVVKGR